MGREDDFSGNQLTVSALLSIQFSPKILLNISLSRSSWSPQDYRRMTAGELSNVYFLAKFRFDTAENEPSKVCRIPRPWLVRRRRPGRLQLRDAAELPSG